MKNDLTANDVKNLLSYDGMTGVFTRKVVTSRRVKVGDVAGTRTTNGYIVINIKGHRHQAHRLAYLLHNDRWPADQLDHINGVRDDNRICNLRDCTRAQNAYNIKAHADSASRLKGVHHINQNPDRKKSWRACIRVEGKSIHIGVFETKELAAQAYDISAAKSHGEFVNFNYRRPAL